jgi:hypothetical protein
VHGRSRSPFTVRAHPGYIGDPQHRGLVKRAAHLALDTHPFAQAQMEMQQLAQGGDAAGDPSPRQRVSTGSLNGPLPMPTDGKFEACCTHCTGRTCYAPAAATARPRSRCTVVLPQSAHAHSPLRPPRALSSCALAHSLPSSCPAFLFLQAIKSAYGHLSGALRSLLESNKLRSRMLRHSPCVAVPQRASIWCLGHAPTRPHTARKTYLLVRCTREGKRLGRAVPHHVRPCVS